MGRDQDQQTARQGRFVALVIAGSMLFWIAAQWVGPMLGLPGRYALLIDLAVLAALFWAMVVTYQIWRKRRDNEG
ncbi:MULTISPECIES: DUF5337 domain-containing protein [Primorskyibacter]|uniref:DUF5337 domain-containing protein n=1 Tax=Primorskyibacter flagellatus TaxID=1387277 RepID=A0A1W2BIA3_9RHOB|nr:MULTISPECIES: DUF5337 domain-containing protein [Primorskyibacter]SMC72679.1 hypothetical protein SAMN06295998_10466 [Primorskyibacter flagellatus]